MKKILSLLVATLSLFMFSCFSPATPSDVAVQFYQHIAAGEYDEAVACIDFSAMSVENQEEAKNTTRSVLTEKIAPSIERKGGLTSIEAISETITENETGKSAVVKVKLAYGNGTVDEDNATLIFDENNKEWKISVSK